MLRELLWEEQFRLGWAVACGVILLAGAVLLAMATGIIHLKETYFSLTPEHVAFRVAIFGKEQLLPWQEVEKLWITEYFVVFERENRKPVIIRLGSIQQQEVAQQVIDSLRAVAHRKGIPINGVNPQYQQAAAM